MTVILQLRSVFKNPSKLTGGFGTELALDGSTLFMGDGTADRVDLVSGQTFENAGCVYVHDIETDTTTLLVSPQPRTNGTFGASIEANELYLCVNEKTIDTKDTDSGVVHIFDRETLTHLSTIQPPILPRLQQPQFSANKDTLFCCYGGYKDGKDKDFFLAGQIQVVSLDPLSPSFGSIIKTIDAPTDKQGGLTIRGCRASDDVLLVNFLRYAHPKGTTEVSEEGFLLYDLRNLHYEEVPFKYVSQAVGAPYLTSLHSNRHIHNTLISVMKTDYSGKPGPEVLERIGFYRFDSFDLFDVKSKPDYVPTPLGWGQASGFGEKVVELQDEVLVSTPFRDKLGDGSKYYGDIYSLEKSSIGTAAPVLTPILRGDPSRPRVGGYFRATGQYLADGLKYTKHGGIVEIYDVTLPSPVSTLRRGGVVLAQSLEPSLMPQDIWDCDTVLVPSNPKRGELDASTVAMLEAADKDGLLPASLRPIQLVDGKRSSFVQALLFARYFKHTNHGGPAFALASLPGQSFHEFGLAIDVNKADAGVLKGPLEKAGLKQSSDEAWHFTASASSQIAKAIQRRKDLEPLSAQYQALLGQSFTAKVELIEFQETIDAETLKAKVLTDQISQVGAEIKKVYKEQAGLAKKADALEDDTQKAEIALHSAKQTLKSLKYTACPNGLDFTSCDHTDLKNDFLLKKKTIEQKVKALETDYAAKAAGCEIAKDKVIAKQKELDGLEAKKKSKAIELSKLKQNLSKLMAKVKALEDSRAVTNLQIEQLLAQIDTQLIL